MSMRYEATSRRYCRAKASIHQSYKKRLIRIEVVCDGDLTTSIRGEATLEGLNVYEEWMVITDSLTIEQYGMQFLQNLDL